MIHIKSLTGAWQFRQLGTEEWLNATVPGSVHTNLMALGRIPDPFRGDNERRVQWVAEADWEYSYEFTVSTDLLDRKYVRLICDGLDTIATVKLNGLRLGHTENMFRQYQWNIKSFLRIDKNELKISFESPVKHAARKQAIRPLSGVSAAIPGGPHIRKAPCHFGWDWGPQLPSIGIWKDIRLEAFDSARFSDVHLRQFHSNGKVKLKANLAVENWIPGLSTILKATAPDGKEQEVSSSLLSPDNNFLELEIENPHLWWPNGWGEQPLYNLRIQLHEDNTVLDEKKYQLGLRTIELLRQPDEWGNSFTFSVNGRPLFAKGSNWIPADSFPARLTEATLENLIRSAAETHQNMLRVWGGGFYEDESFYDLCDRYGILVWQDFIFACSVYPLNEPDFIENVRVEVIENIRRLRHRASLALWCGNNEMEWGWVDWGWDNSEQQDLKEAYDSFFHHMLPELCAVEDPDRAYWPSSPSSDIPFNDPNSQQQGDAHYWDVWHKREPFTAYRNQYPRFMSEFGFQALPPVETIRTYAEEQDWNMTSYIMEQHQKHDSGNALIVSQMLETFRLPKDFESLVYLSMVLQAEGIRYGVEHWRRHTGRVSGTLYWQLNDCWPVASWSSLDYFGRWKALHYTARRFFAPLLLSIEDSPPRQSIFLSSDLLEEWHGSVHWRLTTLDGKILESDDINARVESLSVANIENLDFSRHMDDDTRRDLVFVAEFWQGNQCLGVQTAFFVPTKHLRLKDPEIKARVRSEEKQLTIELSACSFARLIECSLDGADVIFSDNYFDLPANKKISINACLPEGWDIDRAKAALKVQSIYNTFSK